MLDKLSHADFQNLDDKSFEIDFGEAGKLTARLEKTAGFDLDPGEDQRDPFSVFLRCAAPAQQSTYAVTHATLGKLDLFLVPIEENDDGVLFEAVFA